MKTGMKNQVRARAAAILGSGLALGVLAGVMMPSSEQPAAPQVQAAERTEQADRAEAREPVAFPDGSCNLTPAEQDRAAEAFEALMPVLQHPRCANCHNGIDVFAASAEDAHGGGQMDRAQFDKQGSQYCMTCHTEAPGGRWRQPEASENMAFAGRTAADICKSFKANRPIPGSLEGHVENDGAIEAAFIGKRGQPDLQPAPPGMSKDQFLDQTRAWLAALKVTEDTEEWPADPACGCERSKRPKYSVTVHHWTVSEKHGKTFDVYYSASLDVDPHSESGELVGTGTYSGSVVSHKVNCKNAEPDNPQTYNVSGKLEATGFAADAMAGFTLVTTDWELLPMGFGSLTAQNQEQREAVAGAGTVTTGLLTLSGPRTAKSVVRPQLGGDTECTGEVKSYQEISVDVAPDPKSKPGNS